MASFVSRLTWLYRSPVSLKLLNVNFYFMLTAMKPILLWQLGERTAWLRSELKWNKTTWHCNWQHF